METGVMSRGQGQAVAVVGDRYTMKATGRDTGGAFALMEALVPPGAGPPPHVHHREDEAFYVLEGTLEFHVDGRAITAGPGSWVTLAKGSLHRFQNVGPTPARMLIVVTPAGLEQYFLEVGRRLLEGEEPSPATPDEFAQLVASVPKYGLEIHPPTQ